MNQNVIALLERRLAEAKAGKLTSVAIIAAEEAGGLRVDHQGNALLMLAGAIQLQEQLRVAIFEPSPAARSGPPGTTRFSS